MITVECPICNKRLFDVEHEDEAKGLLKTKCPQCRKVISIHLDNFKTEHSLISFCLMADLYQSHTSM